MIKIIKDITKNYTSLKKNAKVSSLETYFNGRKCFLESYNNKEDFELIIKNKKFFDFFLDFEEYSNVEVEYIKEMKTENNLLEQLPEKYDIFSILLFFKKNSNIDRLKISQKYLKEYPEWILNRIISHSPDLTIQFLVNGLIFSSYKSYNFCSLMNTQEEYYNFFKTNEALKSSFIENFNYLGEYTLKTNETLIENKSKLDIFTNFKLQNYLKNISGVLRYERDFFIKNFLKSINTSREFQFLNNILLEYSNIFKEDTKKISKFLAEFEEILSFEKLNLTTIEEWKSYYKEKYLKVNGIFYTKTFLEKIEEIENTYFVSLIELKLAAENILTRISNSFEKFYLNNYHYLYSSEYKKNLEYCINENKEKIFSTKKQLVIFIDCLRYDIWLKLKEYFENKGFFVQGEDIIVSGIPTITNYCKKMLYFGKKYNIISKTNYLEGLQDLFLEKEIFKLIERSQFHKLKEEDKLFLYEIADLDNMFHDTKDINKSFPCNSLIDLRLNELLENINPNEYSILLMTDHGARQTKKEEKFNLDIKSYLQDKNLNYDIQGRSIRIYGDYFDREIYENLKKKLISDNNFYILDRDNFYDYYLPVTEKSCENYFILLYKENSAPINSGDYTHGSVSLEEVMIPFCVLSNKKKEYEKINISILKDTITLNKINDIEILVENNNELKNIKCYLENYKSYQLSILEFSEWGNNKKISLPVKLNDSSNKILKDNLVIEFDNENMRKIEKFPLILKIEKDVKEVLNQKLKTSRSLL